MLKSVYKSWLGIVGVAMLVMPAISEPAFSQSIEPLPTTTPSQSSGSSQNLPFIPALTVIQGQVSEIQGDVVTVKTPPIRPICRRTGCPQYIIAGVTFSVDISNAVFESATGDLVPKNLRVGESIIVAGKHGPTLSVSGIHVLYAEVVETA